MNLDKLFENGWNTFANEFEALVQYKYSVENLSAKKENELFPCADKTVI